jgi:hypothetical protein
MIVHLTPDLLTELRQQVAERLITSHQAFVEPVPGNDYELQREVARCYGCGSYQRLVQLFPYITQAAMWHLLRRMGGSYHGRNTQEAAG